ncbi:uncharacterized protein LOC119587691 [Penaeus monodon]|uniref:uncharacterized protein LOC119587691 n=1 Tax=Penaeus monodon TaxID=6687 RepID=UPI0018A70812|nr:uncharacterized protein LOC119587691 [Penaeus monodon]
MEVERALPAAPSNRDPLLVVHEADVSSGEHAGARSAPRPRVGSSSSAGSCSSDASSDGSSASASASPSSCSSATASDDYDSEDESEDEEEGKEEDADPGNDEEDERGACDDAVCSSSTAWVWVPGGKGRGRMPNAGLGKDLTDASVCELIRLNSSGKNSGYSNFDFAFLVRSNDEYSHLLKGLLDVQNKMKELTPQHIRQHFDVAFKQVELLQQFQQELNEAEHFPNFKKNLMTPSLRVNFYALVLKSLKSRGSRSERESLQRAIDYLNLVNRKANTEMTVASVMECPVDLRLSGDLLLVDEFHYVAGPLTKKKYTLVLFEHILLFTLSSITCFRLMTYCRPGQIESIESGPENELHLYVKPTFKQQFIRHIFRPRNASARSLWEEKLQTLVPSYRASSRKGVSVAPRTADLLPLSLTSEYPQLQAALVMVPKTTQSDPLGRSEIFNEESLQNLVVREENYIRQLSQITQENRELPRFVLSILTQILSLHNRNILPKLRKACQQGLPKVLLCFEDVMDDLGIYSEYLAATVQVNHLPDSAEQPDPVTAPIHHFVFYLSWLSEQGRQTEAIVAGLHAVVANARARILTEAIVNSRVDFFRSGKVLRCDTLRVATPHKGIRSGIYRALLFKKLIILTRVRAPFYEYVCDIRLDEVNLGPLKGSYPTDFRLEVRRGGGRGPQAFEFRARTQEARDAWLAHLRREFHGQAEAIKRQSSFSHL